MIHIPPNTFPPPEERAEPFRIEPIFKERIWGSRSLASLFPEKSNLPEPIGEAWLTAVECRVATGRFAGKTLGEAWREMPAEAGRPGSWRGAQFEEPGDFPLLVKFIFPVDKLSIQVHPDDAYAAAHEKAAGGRGKTEMWHVVSAEPGARLLAGLKPSVTKDKFRAALAGHTLEELFQSHEVSAGDTFFIPAGMPHTIGPGMILCEVQEYSDLTYRVYDYGRVDAKGKPRELHIEKALEVMQFAGGNESRIATHSVALPGGNSSTHLAGCGYFYVDRSDLMNRLEVRRTDRHVFCLWVFLSGEGTVEWVTDNKQDQSDGISRGSFQYRRGECWFIPASLVAYDIKPEQKSALLEVSVPVAA